MSAAELRIDELVLDGFGADDRAALIASLREELGRLGEQHGADLARHAAAIADAITERAPR